MKKLIAITGPSASSQQLYDLIESLGFNYIFVNQNDTENLKEIAQMCDALILAGGVDLFPPYFDVPLQTGYALETFDQKRDLREGILFQEFNNLNKTIWGICRGFQKIAIELGLAEYFLLDISFADPCHAPGRAGMKLDTSTCDYAHKINFTDDSDSVWVNSLHHQGVIYAPQQQKNIDIIAWCDNTLFKKNAGPNTIEWFEAGDNIMAQQFHPENNYKYCLTSQEIVENFVQRVNAQ